MERFRAALRACPPGSVSTGHLERDRNGHPIASMTVGACRNYYLAGAAVSGGAALEFGTWAGASATCIAAGVNLTGRRDSVYGFDMFEVGYAGESNTEKLWQYVKGTEWEPRALDGAYDIMPLFLFYTRHVYPSIKAVRADLRRDVPGLRRKFDSKMLDLWTTDSAKTWKQLAFELNVVQSYLQPGAIVILSDCFYDKNYKKKDRAHKLQRDPNLLVYVYGHLVPTYLELLAIGEKTSHGFFGLRQKLPPEAVIKDIHPKSSDVTFWRRTWKLALEDVKRAAPTPARSEELVDSINLVFKSWLGGASLAPTKKT